MAPSRGCNFDHSRLPPSRRLFYTLIAPRYNIRITVLELETVSEHDIRESPAGGRPAHTVSADGEQQSV